MWGGAPREASTKIGHPKFWYLLKIDAMEFHLSISSRDKKNLDEVKVNVCESNKSLNFFILKFNSIPFQVTLMDLSVKWRLLKVM